jgi:hypothetical protein
LVPRLHIFYGSGLEAGNEVSASIPVDFILVRVGVWGRPIIKPDPGGNGHSTYHPVDMPDIGLLYYWWPRGWNTLVLSVAMLFGYGHHP